MRGLYIHVPFCSRKCDYCDFTSYADRVKDIDAYLEALRVEAALYAELHGTFDTVYIGGGTPTLLSAPQLKQLVSVTETLTGDSLLKEFTMEANPESVTAEKADILISNGVNRISIGLQSSRPELLKKIGRTVSPEKFARAWSIFRNAGFRNMNADLMTGLPGQTLDDFRESVKFLSDFKPEHLSLYPLEVHEDTPLGKSGAEENPDGAADMYDEACRILPAAGLERYEISSFAKKGYESRHNLHYWLQEEYLGLGPAAASYINGERRTTTSSLDLWMKELSAGRFPSCTSRETLKGREKDAEKLILGLRLAGGIEIPSNIFIEFKKEFGSETAREFLDIQGCRIKLKPDRMYLANRIFTELI